MSNSKSSNENNNKIKATEFLIESLKLIVTISTLFLGGLLAYSSIVMSSTSYLFFWLSLCFFILSSLSSVVNIHSLINKIHRSELDAIKDKSVKMINIFTSVFLFLAIVFGVVFLSCSKSDNSQCKSRTSTMIDDKRIVVGDNESSEILIKKTKDGKIRQVKITPKIK